MPSSSPPASTPRYLPHAFPKRCSCGKTYSHPQWLKLPYRGIQSEGGEIEGHDAELRNCPCGSTLAVDVPGTRSLDGTLLPFRATPRGGWTLADGHPFREVLRLTDAFLVVDGDRDDDRWQWVVYAMRGKNMSSIEASGLANTREAAKANAEHAAGTGKVRSLRGSTGLGAPKDFSTRRIDSTHARRVQVGGESFDLTLLKAAFPDTWKAIQREGGGILETHLARARDAFERGLLPGIEQPLRDGTVKFAGMELLFSYQTLVAARDANGKFYETDKKWSRTTSAHIRGWLREHGYPQVEKKPQAEFDRIFSELRAEGLSLKRDRVTGGGYTTGR